MANENGSDRDHPRIPPQIPENLGKTIFEPVGYGLAAAERRALELGVPVHTILETLLNHVASVAAMVEPPGAREKLIKDIVAAIPKMIAQHVQARHTTPGGVILPGGVKAEVRQ